MTLFLPSTTTLFLYFHLIAYITFAEPPGMDWEYFPIPEGIREYHFIDHGNNEYELVSVVSTSTCISLSVMGINTSFDVLEMYI